MFGFFYNKGKVLLLGLPGIQQAVTTPQKREREKKKKWLNDLEVITLSHSGVPRAGLRRKKKERLGGGLVSF